MYSHQEEWRCPGNVLYGVIRQRTLHNEATPYLENIFLRVFVFTMYHIVSFMCVLCSNIARISPCAGSLVNWTDSFLLSVMNLAWCCSLLALRRITPRGQRHGPTTRLHRSSKQWVGHYSQINSNILSTHVFDHATFSAVTCVPDLGYKKSTLCSSTTMQLLY